MGKYGKKELSYQTCNPEISPADFDLLPKFKKSLNGERFGSS
jgi:hypothetical protein